MILIYLTGGLYLGYELGRNNLSNVFGLAIGTRMLPFYLGAVLAACFVFLGALMSGAGTAQSVTRLAEIQAFSDAFAICLSSGIVLSLLTCFGVPVSIAQSIIGAYIGFSFFYGLTVPLDNIYEIIFAWSISPFLALIGAYIFFKILRFLLRIYPVRILYRDIYVRLSLIGTGIFSAYALGANNVSAIAAPYMGGHVFPAVLLTVSICFFVAVGFFRADKSVIQTLSKGVFPLSPLEAFTVVFTSAVILFLFSSQSVKTFLLFFSLPSFPLVPLSISHAVIGAIVGVAMAKGAAGLKTKTLGKIILSWFIVPSLSFLICFTVLTIVSLWEKILNV